MILRRQDGHLWLFMQTDHARLSGVMAAHWGNGDFRPSVDQERTAAAIGRHDDGWLAWEQDPRVNRETDRPFNFTEMPVDDILTIWYLGPKQAGERDPYAGLLLSRHGSYLLDRRLSGSEDTPADRERIRHYLLDQETLRERLSARLSRTEPDPAPSLLRGLDHAYRLLQIADLLSLHFCTGPLHEDTISDVPRTGLEDRVELHASPLDERTLTLHPWPFSASEILLPVPVHILPDRDYTTYSDLKNEMIAAGPTLLTFRLARE